MQGVDVRKAREVLGWNRPELASATGYGLGEATAISPGRISRIESGAAISPEEAETLARVIQPALQDAPITGAPPGAGQPWPPGNGDPGSVITPMPGVDSFDTGVHVLEEWAGLRQGDTVRLSTDTKPREYVFMRHVAKPAQEYVEVRLKQRSGRIDPRSRTVAPTTVLVLKIAKRRKEWVHAVQDAG